MDKQQAIDLIRGSSLAGQADMLIEHLLPSARVMVQDESDGTDIGPVTSHLGGLPSLPRDAKWPLLDSRDHMMDRIARLEEKFRSNPKATGLRRHRRPDAPGPANWPFSAAVYRAVELGRACGFGAGRRMAEGRYLGVLLRVSIGLRPAGTRR